MNERPHGGAANRRVAVVLHEPTLGGATLSVLRIVPLLAARGWEFSFWAPRPSALYDHLAGEGHDVEGAPRHIEYGLRAWSAPPGPRARAKSIRPYLRRFREFLDSRAPELVHANSIATAPEAFVAHRQGRAVLLHVHEILPRGIRAALLRRAAWHAGEVAAVSRASAARLRRRGSEAHIVYEGAPIPKEAARIRADPRPFVVGTVGVVSRRKGSDLYVEAAHRLLACSDGFRFEMVGAPTDPVDRVWGRGVVTKAEAIGIDYKSRADTSECYRRWDAFVLPSRTDPFPIAMLEAMAFGLPVIGARRDGLVEQVDAGCGILVEPEDPEALARAIATVADLGQAGREAMGQAARDRVASMFNLERQADAINDCYVTALYGSD